MGNQVRILITAKDEVSGQVDKIRDKMTVLGKTDFGKGLLQGAGIAGFNALKGAAMGALDSVLDFAKGSVQAAIDEEAGVARLNAALAANIKGWDGSTDAIERGIAARVDMGFADDDIRESMTHLISMTRDVALSQRAQAAAMDLARKSGRTLVDASDAVGKAMQGNKKMLKELGIATSDAGDAMQTLGEIEKAVNGQAAAFAEATAGRIEVAKARIAGWQDELGASAVQAADDFGLAVGFIGYAVTHLEANQDLDKTFEDWAQGLQDVKDAATQTSALLQGDLYKATTVSADSIGELNRMYRSSARTVAGLAGTTEDAGSRIETANHSVSDSFKSTAHYLLGEYTDDFDKAMAITEARADLHAAKTDADRAKAYADLAEQGALSKDGYTKWIHALERLARDSKGKVHAAYLDAIADIRALRATAKEPVVIKVKYKKAGSTGPEERAVGGPVVKGQPYIVGEKRPELFIPDQNGRIVPSVPSASAGIAAGGGGASITINVSTPVMTPGSAQALADAIAPAITRWQQARGL